MLWMREARSFISFYTGGMMIFPGSQGIYVFVGMVAVIVLILLAFAKKIK